MALRATMRIAAFVAALSLAPASGIANAQPAVADLAHDVNTHAKAPASTTLSAAATSMASAIRGLKASAMSGECATSAGLPANHNPFTMDGEGGIDNNATGRTA